MSFKREDEKVLHKSQVSYSALTSQFLLVLTLSTSIASLGLMADSAVAVVGAMLIAPLMKPILAYAYGIVAADWRLQLRAAITMFAGVFVTMFVAGLAEKIIGLRGPTEQIMSRTQPSLIDLGVAIAAGVAASLASTRRNIADTLPGVAIAVALVPPLCVAGIGFSEGNWHVGWGATLLFAVNLVAIVLAAAIVFFAEGIWSSSSCFPWIVVDDLDHRMCVIDSSFPKLLKNCERTIKLRRLWKSIFMSNIQRIM